MNRFSATAFYLLLPMMVMEAGLIVYILGQGSRATTNRLFAAYMTCVLVTDGTSLIRATTVSENLAFTNALILAPLLALNTLLLMWLTMALFIPQRFAQSWVRWLIALPYLLGFVVALLDLMLGWGFWFGGLTQVPAGTWALNIKAQFNPLLIGLILAQAVSIIMQGAVAVRHPARRVAATTLFIGNLFSFLILSAPQTRGVPVIYNLAPLPIYLAFAWATLRYQLFRPAPIALQTALDSLPDGVVFLDGQRQIRYANRAAQALFGRPSATSADSYAAALARAALVADEQQPNRYQRHGETPLMLDTTELAIPGDRRGLRIVVLHDITAIEQQALELRAQNDEQRRLLDLVDVLETSAVSIAEDVLFAPIVGHLDSRRAQAFTARLLHTAHQQRTRLVILDITGVPVVDAAVAKALLHTATALQLLGCNVALSGISASTATTLVHQDADFSGFTTVRSPQEALLAHGRAS